MTNTARFTHRLSINPRGWLAMVATLLVSACGAGSTVAGPEPTGALEVSMSGLPEGMQGRVVVSGPNTSETLIASKTFNDLTPGTYTIVAEEIDTEDLSYAAAAATQVVNVSAGVKTTKKVDYQPGPMKTGGYNLDVDGLPIAINGSVTITGPKGYHHFLTRSTITDGIPVGNYTVSAESVTLNGTTYNPDPVSQTLEVSRNTIKSGKVRYRAGVAATGTLAVATSGLPAGAAASVRITGPNGFDQIVTNTTSINGLPTGDYTIVAQGVTVGGTSYNASPANQVATVSGNATTSKSVNYTSAAATTGTLTVKVSGLPSGAAANVTVTGPNGFTQVVTSTTTISGAAVGSYTLTPEAVVVAGTTYEPRDASLPVVVTAGAVTTETVMYLAAAPTVGSLAITVGGLPVGALSPITVTGPNGYSRSITASTTIDGLEPGSYTIAAGNLVISGVTSIASPASQVATVTAGATTSKSVTYAVAAPTTGTLSIVTSGLPTGAAAAITVTGPNSFTQAVTTTTSISGAAIGVYTVAAQNVVVAGVTYQPANASQVATVVAGVTATVTVAYSAVVPQVGTLSVSVSGLVSGVPASITVTGPNGYSHAVTATESIASLPVGTYTITAGNVTAGSTTYTPSATSQSAAVVAGGTVTRTVAYTAVVGAATVTVDTTVRFQQMRGWEATAQAGQAEPGFSGWQNELMDLAANDLGINRLRVELASGAENSVDYYAQFRAGQITSTQFNATRYQWVNDNSDPNTTNASGFKWTKLDEAMDGVVVPMRQRLAARGEALYLTMNYVSFGGSTAQQSPAEYAELILAAFQHLQSRYGFVPNALEVILEPDNGTVWTGTSIGQLIATTGARLAAAGFRPDFIAPSVMNMANAVSYLDQIVAVSGARSYLTDIAYHRYAGVSDANLSAIRSRASQYGIRAGMLEHIGSGVEDLYRDLTLANASAWQQYTLAYPTPDNGGHYYGIEGGRPVIASRSVVLRQYFKYVRSGAWRVSASSTNGSVRPVAFTNPGSGMAVVLHIDAAGSYTVRGMRNGTYEVKMATASGSVVSLSTVTVTTGGTVTVNPTQTGVLTLNRVS